MGAEADHALTADLALAAPSSRSRRAVLTLAASMLERTDTKTKTSCPR